MNWPGKRFEHLEAQDGKESKHPLRDSGPKTAYAARRMAIALPVLRARGDDEQVLAQAHGAVSKVGDSHDLVE